MDQDVSMSSDCGSMSIDGNVSMAEDIDASMGDIGVMFLADTSISTDFAQLRVTESPSAELGASEIPPQDDGLEVDSQVLHYAIATCPEGRLRTILGSLVETNESVRNALTEQLITVKHTSDPDSEWTEEWMPRWVICANCLGEYDTGLERYPGECRYHSGILLANEKSFADWDEICLGPIASEENQKRYPETFNWSCCGRIGSEHGCMLSQHRHYSASQH